MRKHYFLVGIGGISMSGIAKILKLSGNKVSGSDIQENNEIKLLRKMDIKVIINQKPENITKDIDELIYTSAAVHPNSPGIIEIKKAKKLKIITIKRSKFIRKLMEDKFGITIAGMHGKTTTTAMLGYVLKKINQNPIVLLGGEFSKFSHQNLEFPSKESKYFITEGCEYDRSFLDFKTKTAIITNIEEEHLDYFKRGLPEILEVFQEFISKIPQNGFVVACKDDKNIKRIVKYAKCKVYYYSQDELAKWNIKLLMPGKHNQLNALAVLKLIQQLGINVKQAKKILSSFPGVRRRFEILAKLNKTIFIDDYAHHPTEIKATLRSARQYYKNKKILVIFQPHQYSRTKLLLNDFSMSFSNANLLVITDVYEVAGREEDKSVGSKELVEKIKKLGQRVEYLPKYNNIFEFLKQNYQKFDVIITMGAGPIDTVVKKFLKEKI